MCKHYRNNPHAIEEWAVWAGFRPKLPDAAVQDEVWAQARRLCASGAIMAHFG